MKTQFTYNFVSKFKLANIISIILVLVSLVLIGLKGLNFGIDFKGGTLIELRVDSNNIKINDVRSAFSNMGLGDLNVKEFGKKGDYLIKFEKKEFDNTNTIKNIKEKVINKLGVDINFRRVEDVGPKVSAELLNSGLIAISLALGAMLFYIWIRFEWQFSLGSITAIFHDVTIVGYSMNDTVVIYDRIRENLSKYSSSTIDDISNTSINETLSRTIITSVTTLLALGSIFVLGGEILKGFSLAMIIGVIIGTYSSIFVASPILKYLNVSYKSIAKDVEKN